MQNHQTPKNTRPIAPSEYSTAELIALLDKHFGDYTPRHANAISRRAMHQAATMARGIKAACRLAAEAYRNGNTPPDISDLIHLLEAQTEQVACLIAVSQYALESTDDSVKELEAVLDSACFAVVLEGGAA